MNKGEQQLMVPRSLGCLVQSDGWTLVEAVETEHISTYNKYPSDQYLVLPWKQIKKLINKENPKQYNH